MIHHCNRYAFINLVLFTVHFYHFLFSRYLSLTKRHFLSDILVPFPDSSNLDSHEDVIISKYNLKKMLQKLPHSLEGPWKRWITGILDESFMIILPWSVFKFPKFILPIMSNPRLNGLAGQECTSWERS